MKAETYFLALALFFTCQTHAQMKEKADLLLTGGRIYTVDERNPVCQAMAIRDGRVVAVGSTDELSGMYEPASTRDLHGSPVFPGFIDAHCHFVGYALGLQYIDLNGTRSFDEVVDRLSRDRGSRQNWVVGRGWDQNLWKIKEFPDNRKLNELFPGTPVMLIRVDGHVVLANDEALRRAGFFAGHRFTDGQVEMKNGRMTGILSENAADLMRDAVPKPSGKELESLIRRAQENLLAVGLTGVADAGLDYDQVMTIDSLQKKGILHLNVYAMLTPNRANIDGLISRGPYSTGQLEVRSVKIYADGSLGSRTARLKRPYSDAADASGIIVTPPDTIRSLCRLALEHGYQVNTHCIGDSAVSLVLGIYGGFLKGTNDLRWRIEHAQVVDPSDLHLFRDYAVIPSVQATHATSDMAWAGSRLGPERVHWAYAYRDLMKQNGWIPNGTDFPIENISPLLTFYAAVGRMDLSGSPEGGFQPENALSREEALRSITTWAAKAGFLENRKGRLAPGMDADFVILDQDIMTIPLSRVPGVKVIQAFIGGVKVL